MGIRIQLDGTADALAVATLPGPATDDDLARLRHLGLLLSRCGWLLERLGHPADPTALIDRINDGATLAGRLAHDYDNLWTGILGFAELAIPALPPGSHEQQYIQEVATTGQRGIQMTAQLHQFSRSGAVKPLPTHLGPALSREQARLKQSFNGRIRWTLEVPADLPAVAVETSVLQTVLGHLLDNAVEAMPQGGPLRIHADCVELTHLGARAFLGNPQPGRHVRVRITDAGTGIKEDVKRRLFHQPFFSTKPRHRGLGLAIVYRSLYVHRGGLTLESELGKGTIVEVVLPLAGALPPAPTRNS